MHRMLVAVAAIAACVSAVCAQTAVKAKTLYTMAGESITDGVVLIDADGLITAVGPAAEVAIPAGATVYECAVATPGLVDVRGTVGLTGIYNTPADQDMIERSSPIQPELRALDAYNPREPLVRYVRSFGVTTVHTGPAPGELVTGQTIIVKTRGDTVEQALLVADKAVTATLGPGAQRHGSQSPGTRAKEVEMLRAKLIKAREFLQKETRDKQERDNAEGDDNEDGESENEDKAPPARDLALEPFVRVLKGDQPLIITANRAQDIAGALRLADEFGFTLWLDSAAEAYTMTDAIKAAGVPVLLHPTMARAYGETANLSYHTAADLAEAGVLFAIESGYEAYVSKVRVVLFEAAVAAGYGELGFDRALRSITIDAARVLGLDDRLGSLEVGKDGDVAMYDADPFEYTTHCTGVLIEGEHFAGEQEFDLGYPEPGY